MLMKDTSLEQLINISQYYGNNIEYVIAGGGNTSFKDKENIWVKASGTSLSTIKTSGFVCLSRSKLKLIKEKNYSPNSTKREEQVKQDLKDAIVTPTHLRPSVETSMHEIIDYSFIVHTHPTYVNALMCSKNAEILTKEIFGNDIIYIEYTDPGYVLFKKVLKKINRFKKAKAFSPSIIFLQNHGVFVGANSIDEIKNIYAEIEEKLSSIIRNKEINSTVRSKTSDSLAIINNYFADKSLIAKGYINDLIQHFIKTKPDFSLISKPFTPDIIVYCKSNYLFLENGSDESTIQKSIESFQKKFGYFPKVIILENDCLVIIDDSEKTIQIVLEVYLDMMKISLFSEYFGGQNPMTKSQIDFIDNWEVENYRRKISRE